MASELETLNLNDPDDIEATFVAGSLDSDTAEAQSGSGRLASRYDLILQVGAGAMGEVYLAQDTDLLRKVAYKRLLSGMAVNPEVLGRFVREVQITAQLEHPNVVPVYHLEKTDSGWAYAMKLVFGKTFKELIQAARAAEDGGGPIPEELRPPALLEHFLKVCEAMDFAHQRGVIHRDLKPANIMVGRFYEVYVMDWGIARLMGALAHHQESEASNLLELETTEDSAGFDETRVGQILGTPRYLSPEQATGRNAQLDGRSDLFSLGLILHEMVTLQPAYTAGNIIDLLKKVLQAEKAPIKPYAKGRPIPRELEAIVHKATARKPSDRYQRVSELAADLRRHLAGEAVLARPDTRLQAALRWCTQHQMLAAGLVGSLLLLLTAGAVGSLWNQRRLSASLQHREQLLSQLQTQTSRQAQLINNQLMKVAVLLQSLDAAAGQALDGQPLPGPVYLQPQYITPGQTPADFALAFGYNKMISLSEPVFGQASNSPNQAETFARLKGLKQLLPALLARSGGLEPENPAFRSRAFARGLPVVWETVALTQGAWMSYPGQAGYPASYDPRRFSWFNEGIKATEPVWTAPHPDSQGQGLVLPVVQALPAGKGVAVLELRFQYLVDELMNLAIPGLIESYLLDGQGQMMVRSSERSRAVGMGFGAFRPQQAIDTPLFDRDEAVAAIRAGRSGFLRYQRNGRPVLLAYYQLSALGWYYALEVDEEALLNQQHPAHAEHEAKT